MADLTLTQLTAFSTIAPNDIFLGVDVSDTAMSASGSNKSLSYNLLYNTLKTGFLESSDLSAYALQSTLTGASGALQGQITSIANFFDIPSFYLKTSLGDPAVVLDTSWAGGKCWLFGPWTVDSLDVIGDFSVNGNVVLNSLTADTIQSSNNLSGGYIVTANTQLVKFGSNATTLNWGSRVLSGDWTANRINFQSSGSSNGKIIIDPFGEFAYTGIGSYFGHEPQMYFYDSGGSMVGRVGYQGNEGLMGFTNTAGGGLFMGTYGGRLSTNSQFYFLTNDTGNAFHFCPGLDYGDPAASFYGDGMRLYKTPTAPTATAGTNTTQIATTAFATAADTNLSGRLVNLSGNQTVIGTKIFSPTGVSGSAIVARGLNGQVSGLIVAQNHSGVNVASISNAGLISGNLYSGNGGGLTNVVNSTGTQTIAGVKTFSSTPICTSVRVNTSIINSSASAIINTSTRDLTGGVWTYQSEPIGSSFSVGGNLSMHVPGTPAESATVYFTISANPSHGDSFTITLDGPNSATYTYDFYDQGIGYSGSNIGLGFYGSESYADIANMIASSVNSLTGLSCGYASGDPSFTIQLDDAGAYTLTVSGFISGSDTGVDYVADIGAREGTLTNNSGPSRKPYITNVIAYLNSGTPWSNCDIEIGYESFGTFYPVYKIPLASLIANDTIINTSNGIIIPDITSFTNLNSSTFYGAVVIRTSVGGVLTSESAGANVSIVVQGFIK